VLQHPTPQQHHQICFLPQQMPHSSNPHSLCFFCVRLASTAALHPALKPTPAYPSKSANPSVKPITAPVKPPAMASFSIWLAVSPCNAPFSAPKAAPTPAPTNASMINFPDGSRSSKGSTPRIGINIGIEKIKAFLSGSESFLFLRRPKFESRPYSCKKTEQPETIDYDQILKSAQMHFYQVTNEHAKSAPKGSN
jgi:hypothetical protein